MLKKFGFALLSALVLAAVGCSAGDVTSDDGSSDQGALETGASLHSPLQPGVYIGTDPTGGSFLARIKNESLGDGLDQSVFIYTSRQSVRCQGRTDASVTSSSATIKCGDGVWSVVGAEKDSFSLKDANGRTVTGQRVTAAALRRYTRRDSTEYVEVNALDESSVTFKIIMPDYKYGELKVAGLTAEWDKDPGGLNPFATDWFNVNLPAEILGLTLNVTDDGKLWIDVVAPSGQFFEEGEYY